MDQMHKGLDLQCRFPKARNLTCLFQCFKEADISGISIGLYFCKCYISNPPLGNIDNSADCQIILSIIDGLQICQNILDLFSGIKIHTSNDLVWNVGIQELLLKETGLGIGPVKNCKILIFCFPFPHLFTDLPGHIFRFLIAILELLEQDWLTLFVLRPECLLLTPSVIGDHAIGCIQDILCGTIILLQFYHLCIWKYFLKIQNIADIGATKLVNRLIIITDYTQITVLTSQRTDKFELHGIGVLILVHHDVTKTVLIVFQHIRAALEQLHRLHQQVIKIQRIIFLQFLLILHISLRNLLLAEIAFRLQQKLIG